MKFENRTLVHDDIHTYIFYEIDNEIKVVDVYGKEFYSLIMRKFPQKTYENFKTKNAKSDSNNTTNSDLQLLEQLADLVKAGIITTEEFNKKKEEIMHRL